jgi:hypothetical protein
MLNICLSQKALNFTLQKKSEKINCDEGEFSKCDTCCLVQKFIHWCKYYLMDLSVVTTKLVARTGIGVLFTKGRILSSP